MTSPQLRRSLAAEFIGTALLLATVVGSGIMAERLAGGSGAVALLGNTLPTGVILFVLITVFGETSGAHFNPAVTAAFPMRREISARAALTYVGVQVLGALTGMISAHAMFDESLFQNFGENADRAIAMVFGRGGNLRPAPHHFRYLTQSAGYDSADCRSLYKRCLLVHCFDELRQPGGHHRPRVHQHIFRDLACTRPWLHRSAAVRGTFCNTFVRMAIRLSCYDHHAQAASVKCCRRVIPDPVDRFASDPPRRPVRRTAQSGAPQTRDLYQRRALNDPASARRHSTPRRARDDPRERFDRIWYKPKFRQITRIVPLKRPANSESIFHVVFASPRRYTGSDA